MAKSTCTLDGCDKILRSRIHCAMHHSRLKKTGTTDPPRTMEQRFWSKVAKSDGCWEWQGHKFERGYGGFQVKNKDRAAHRVCWEIVHGPIPEGMFIDHLCHNPGCVRPDHLRLATPKQNAENRRGPSASNKHSGVRGVHPNGKGWTAQVGHNGKHLYLGTYSTIEEAEAVAVEARRRLYTHSQN